MPKEDIIIRIYIDKELTKEIQEETFDFGIVPAGEVKEFNFWVLNDSRANLRILNFIIDHPEVEVVKAPTELKPKEIGKLILEWSPSVTLKQGLRATLKISGIELWSPN